MKSWTVVGYTYKADLVCEHDIAVEFETEDPDAPSIFDGAEAILDHKAELRGMDRYDERSFDSGDFPKVVFADQIEEGFDTCGRCGDSLI